MGVLALEMFSGRPVWDHKVIAKHQVRAAQPACPPPAVCGPLAVWWTPPRSFIVFCCSASQSAVFNEHSLVETCLRAGRHRVGRLPCCPAPMHVYRRTACRCFRLPSLLEVLLSDM